jgi:hypothetical protein
MEALDVRRYLERAFTDNYKEKFDRVIQPNEFSVSTLVSGPNQAVRYRALDYDPDAERNFNVYFFRGSAIHEHVNRRLGPRDWLTELELSMEFDGIKVYGHPDAVSPGVEGFPVPAVLEFKTFDSENLYYRRQVLTKAQRQAGCYAKMMQEYDGEYYEAYVVFLDFVKKTPLTDAEILTGKGMRNGLVEVELSQMDKEKKAMLNDPIVVFKVTPEEVDHSYNYVRWCARQAWERMNLEA